MPIDQNGAVVRGTLSNLELGVRSSPMSHEAIAPVLDQAVAFTARVVETYGR